LDKEGKLTAGRRGAPLVLAFVYSIQNPNNMKVMLDDIKFTVFFEDADINTLTYFEDNIIPAKSTDYFRITGVFDAMVVTGNPNVRESKVRTDNNLSSADLVKKWWEGISDFTFPIKVNGTATFVGPDGKNIIVPFEGTFPPK
jgi:LEA14-like dessication related protein